MTHDIAHCEGGNCPQKERCRRYLAHLDAKRLKLGFITYITPKKDCNMFWEDTR